MQKSEDWSAEDDAEFASQIETASQSEFKRLIERLKEEAKKKKETESKEPA